MLTPSIFGESLFDDFFTPFYYDDKDEEDKKGNYIRKERYAGSMSRSFYVGKHVTVEDVHPKYESGILSFSVPKEEAKPVEEKKHYISIEG